MIRRLSLSCLALLLLALLAAPPAWALFIPPPRVVGCDGMPDQTRPSSFDLAARADVILVAEGVADVAMPGDDNQGFPVVEVGEDKRPTAPLRTKLLLKGQAPERFTLRLGFYVDTAGAQSPWPECERFAVRKGQSYLLYLRRDGQGLSILPVVPAETALRHQGANDYATRLARLYLDMQRDLSPQAQLDRLDAMLRDRLRPDAGPEEQWQARQIMDHLRSISPLMPTAHLLSLHALFSEGRMPPWGLRRGYHGGRFDGRPWSEFVTGTYPAPDRPSDRVDARDGIERVMVALSTGHHPEAAPLFDTMLKSNNDPTQIRQAISHAVHSVQGQRALDLLTAHYLDLTAVPSFWSGFAILDLGRTMAGQVGLDRSAALWRADPVLAAQWPLLAARLAAQARLRHGDLKGTALGMAAATGPLVDSRAAGRNDIARAQAAAGSPAALKWARSWLKSFTDGGDKSGPAPGLHEPDRGLAFAMLLQAGDRDQTRAIAQTLFCRDGLSLYDLLERVEEDAQDFELAAAILASDGLTPLERSRLIDTLVGLYGRNARPVPQAMRDPADIKPGRTAMALLDAAYLGERGPGVPFTCPPGSARSRPAPAQ